MPRSLPSRALSGIASPIIGLFVLLDMAAGPALRPLARLIADSSPIEVIRRGARRLPAYVALVCLLVPLAFAEPAKIFALYLLGDGHYVSGLVTLVVAYGVSLILVETIYDGARPQLRSMTWFAAVVDRASTVRLAVTTAVRGSRPYRLAHRTVMRVRAWIGRRWSRAQAG